MSAATDRLLWDEGRLLKVLLALGQRRRSSTWSMSIAAAGLTASGAQLHICSSTRPRAHPLHIPPALPLSSDGATTPPTQLSCKKSTKSPLLALFQSAEPLVPRAHSSLSRQRARSTQNGSATTNSFSPWQPRSYASPRAPRHVRSHRPTLHPRQGSAADHSQQLGLRKRACLDTSGVTGRRRAPSSAPGWRRDAGPSEIRRPRPAN